MSGLISDSWLMKFDWLHVKSASIQPILTLRSQYLDCYILEEIHQPSKVDKSI